MNRRRADRLKKRMPCALTIEQKHHSGVVLDLSASGFFVQTNAMPPTGTAVRLELHVPGEERPMLIQTCVARRRAVPPQLKNVAQGGLGLRIESAPEEYYAYLSTLGPQPVVAPAAAAEAEAAPPPRPRREKTKLERQARKLALRRALGPRRSRESRARYRVRVGQGARCRSLEVSAASESEARELAVEQAGSDWKVLDCEAIGS